MLEEEQKYEIIVKYKDGYTIDQIANHMKINKNTVVRWLKRYIEKNNIERKIRTGKKCTTIEQDNKILKIAEDNDKIKLQLIVNMLKENIVISKTTVWRRLKDNNYVYGNYLNKPRLTESQKLKRLEWAKKYINFNWSKVLFSDEATIYLDNSGKCWYLIGHRKINRTTKCIIKRNIWGFITLDFGLCDYKIFEYNLNANKYENILIEHLVTIYNNEYSYQQDNHPVHTSKEIKKLLSEKGIKTIDWPANSPDINPIENLWGLIKRKLSEIILTIDNFEQKIREVIECIDYSSIYNMISNMHLRVQKVIDNEGDIIDY